MTLLKVFRIRPSSIVRTARFASVSVIVSLGAVMFHPSVAAADEVSEFALQAQEMLGQNIWSRVVRLENSNEESRYPEEVYATVFEFDDVLWFYTGTGTQPIERSRNRVDKYRENLLPLLRTIERGFSSLTFVRANDRVGEDFPQLPNGCVIESIFTLEQLRMRGEDVKKANLLLYSTKRAARRNGAGYPRGHAVLIFETPEGRFFVDPPEIKVVKPLQSQETWDPVKFAAAIEAPYGKTEIGKAFFVPVGDTPATATGEETQLYSGERETTL